MSQFKILRIAASSILGGYILLRWRPVHTYSNLAALLFSFTGLTSTRALLTVVTRDSRRILPRSFNRDFDPVEEKAGRFLKGF